MGVDVRTRHCHAVGQRIDVDHRAALRHDLARTRDVRGIGQDRERVRVGQHEAQPLARIVRIEGDADMTAPHRTGDGPDAGHLVDEQEAHDAAAASDGVRDATRDAQSAFPERAIRHALVPVDDRDVVGTLVRPALEVRGNVRAHRTPGPCIIVARQTPTSARDADARPPRSRTGLPPCIPLARIREQRRRRQRAARG